MELYKCYPFLARNVLVNLSKTAFLLISASILLVASSRKLKALLALCTLAISPLSLLARDLPSQRPTDVTGTITLEGQDNFFLTSNDTVLDNGKRYPIRHMAIWVSGETVGRLRSTLTAAANTGKPITLNGFFKWPHHSSELVFCTPIQDLKGG